MLTVGRRCGLSGASAVQVPLSEMFNYVSNLRSMTKGRGSYVMKLDDYKPTPPNIQEEIIAANKVEAK